jgi:flagellar protein FlbD
MIAIERLTGAPFVLNADHIESIEATPDSVITLTNGKKIVSRNSVDEIIAKTVHYKQLCCQTIQVIPRNEEPV